MSGINSEMSTVFKSWFLLQFKPNSYRLAERNLRRQGFETFLPMQEITKRKSRRFVNGLRPLFPGYMFVAINSDSKPWYKINGTLGVSHLVSFEAKPKPVPVNLIYNLMKRCDKEGIMSPKTSLQKGDQVSLLTGPFADFIGKVEDIDADQRIWILMDFMSQSTRISVTPEQLKLKK